MQKFSIDATTRELVEQARTSSGRAAETIIGGHEKVLRQTVMALKGGTAVGEHESPGEASIYVLTGRVRLSSGGNSWEGRTGDLIQVPDARHDLEALEDSAVMLTVAKLP
ncbi:MAG: cupin domain-containing protein [Streptosporangiales bacterium]|nr:cupin domain-containing protein [Streptosporangiales bacterium]